MNIIMMKECSVTKIIYPDLTETREEYNDKYQLISQIDEEGRFYVVSV